MTPQPPAPAPKSKGCLVAVLVVASFGLVLCLVGGFVAWRASKNPELQKAFTVIGKGAKLAIEGAKAPGAEELRKAGCPQAIVLDGQEMMSLMQQFVDAGSDSQAIEDKLGLMVLCQGDSLGSDLPTCDAAAKVYVDAVHPTRPFTVIVAPRTGNKNQCQVKYDEHGVVAK